MPSRVEDRHTFVTELFDYQGGSNIIYHGVAHPGTATSSAGWMIKKFTYDASDNITKIEFAGGSLEQDKVWDSRTTYSFS